MNQRNETALPFDCHCRDQMAPDTGGGSKPADNAMCRWQIEAYEQMAEKLRAQMALKAIVVALNLDLRKLGNGWTEATTPILGRIEEIVDEADRGFRERDHLRTAIEHIIAGSLGTPETVKGYLREVLRGEKP